MAVYPILPPHLVEQVKASATALVETMERDTGQLAPILLDLLLRHIDAEIRERGLNLQRHPDIPRREATIEALLRYDLDHLATLLPGGNLSPEAQEWASAVLADHYPYRAMSDEGLARQLKFKEA
jgi:hypothetical protein